ncbi:hypothetical protein [Spiroplasma sp. BIUS-1]|uniref:hypothetical protein n=1 Tax=Spiroplasma sp. BIUS-1 TaxID=216964 RepID=UPI0013A6C4E3|nr:hypothetical protein [Spiroplasma sp. BIUS-1]
MVFLCSKEKLQKNSYLWIIQIVLFWIAAGYAGNQLKDQINFLDSKSFIVITIFSTSLFLIFLKPLATFVTGIWKNRKIWIQASNGIMILLVILLSLTNLPLWALIITSILLSLSIASSTLFYLFLNEQSFYRIYVLPSVWITFVFMTFSSTFGIYLSNLNIVIGQKALSSNLTLSIILILMLASSMALSFFTKENKNMVQVFDQEILEHLPKKNNKLFLLIYLLGFLLALTSAINNSLVIKLFIALNLTKFNLSDESIYLWMRINDFIYLIPTIFASIISYKILTKIFEQKYLIFINLFVLFGVYTAMAFVQNPFVFIVLNLIAGISFNQIIYSLFSVCMFWNYRARKNPVTGFYGSAMIGAYFLVEVSQNIISELNLGIFKDFSNLKELLEFRNSFDTSAMNNTLAVFDDATTIIMSIACIIVLTFILIFYFMSNKIFADYVKYKMATQNLKVLIKKRVIAKTKTKFDVESSIEEVQENV